jgi:cell wall assembly regulator SMI1
VLYNTWILIYLLTLMNYNKWSMIYSVQYMDLTPPVNIDELQQVEYDMYCTIHWSYSNCWHWWITTNGVWYVLYNTCIVIYLLTLMNYNKWSMICTVQYMDLTPPVNIDEIQQVEYEMYCTIHGSYSTSEHWW